MQIPVESTEYATATVVADRDLTGSIVEVALPTRYADPVTFHPTEVTGSRNNGDGTWTLTYRLLLGPDGTVTLAEGAYDWHVRLKHSTEVIVRKAGQVNVI